MHGQPFHDYILTAEIPNSVDRELVSVLAVQY
jgi:hypothetical protein